MPPSKKTPKKKNKSRKAALEPVPIGNSDCESVKSDISASSMGDKVKTGKTIDDVYSFLEGQDKKIDGLTSGLKDVKDSLAFTHGLAEDNKKEITEIRQKNTDLESRVSLLEKELKACIDRIESDEWRSRQSAVRIFGVPYTKEENIRRVVSNLIVRYNLNGISDPAIADQCIEHCHRLSYHQPNDDKPPGIIVNFVTRPTRFNILKDARKTMNKAKLGVVMVEDMTKKDRALKKAARPQMDAAYAEKKKVWFTRGKLYINSRVVPINQAPE